MIDKIVIIQHVEREGPGFFLNLCINNNIKFQVIKPYLGDSFPKFNTNDGLIVLGGPMGVNDISSNKFHWLKDEFELVRQALTKNIPYLGICLGAQILAFAAGGSVEKLKSLHDPNMNQAEIGWSPIKLVNINIDDPIIRSIDFPLEVLHWHADRIVLPRNATVLASSDRCHEQLFRINNKSYGLQFHTEMSYDDIYNWMNEDKSFLVNCLGNNYFEVLDKQIKSQRVKGYIKRFKFTERIFNYLFV